jgi:aryl-alcohol dehydrogenase-like predicted oxidoreductase
VTCRLSAWATGPCKSLADSYGPYVSEELIRAALHAYPDDLVIATMAGLVRTGPHAWHSLNPRSACPGLVAAPLAGDAAHPGTSSMAHLEENLAAAVVYLTDAQFETLAAVQPPAMRAA